MKKPSAFFSNTLNFFARPHLFFFALLWLMVLLVIGTIQQKYIGLYLAQKTYFSSYIFWLFDLIPLPGGYMIMAIIFVNLLAKLITEKWTKKKLGTLVIHGGALLLLLGGFLTALYSKEGSMVIPEGQSAQYIADYHIREFAITDISAQTHDQTTVIGHRLLREGALVKTEALPFEIQIISYCENCAISRRNDDNNESRRGIYRMIDLHNLPPFKENEDNVSGVVFNVAGAGRNIDGRYAVFENIPAAQHISTAGKTFVFEMRRQRTYLPFSVELVDFKKDVYPGTDQAKAYQSEVIVKDGDINWRSIISMNNPLRYQGYTFYQSSFLQAGEQEITVLAVVKNIGKVFPYIASILICAGLIIHLIIRIPQLTKQGKRS